MVSFRLSIVNAVFIQEHEAENIKNHLDGLKQREKNRVAHIKKQEKLIADCEATLANPPQIEDLDDLNKQLVRFTVDSFGTVLISGHG